MYCVKCGREIPEDALFCPECGCQQENNMKNTTDELVEEVSNKSTKETDIRKKWMILLFICCLILIVAIIWGIIIIIQKQQSEAALADEIIEETTIEVTEEETVTVEEVVPPELLIEGKLLVCVPADYMSLRSTPGLGEDVVDTLLAGTYLEWNGESSVVDELTFYYVKVIDSGKEGYVSSDYCVDVSCFTDESKLGLVETDSTAYTYEMMQEDIVQLCADYPDRLSYNTIGNSIDGRDIYEVVLGNPNAEQHIMLQAAIHGREYMNTQLVMRLLEFYAAYYDEANHYNVTYRDLFEKTAFHIVPMANPDGVTISLQGVQYLNYAEYADYIYECYERDKYSLVLELDSNGYPNWVDYYKDPNFVRDPSEREITFEEYQTIWKANVIGTDLNNNFDAGWESIDLKPMPSYGGFKGYFPVSEPESFALQELALSKDFLCYISYHSRGQLIYYDVNGNSPENSQRSEQFVNFMKDVLKYKPSNNQRAYGVNLGGFGDWVQLSLEKPSITVESGKGICPLDIQEFDGIWYRHKESWAKLAYEYY